MKLVNPTILRLSVAAFTAAVLLTACREKAKPAVDTAPITGKGVYSDSASSSVKVFDQNGRVCIQQSNTYYQLVDVYEGTAKIPLLLKIKKTELCFADSVNKQKVYEISAKSVMDTKNIAWSNDFVATDVEFKDNSLLAVREGADGEEDFLRRFSLLDGKEVFSCSYGEVKVAVPNVKEKRFIGFTSQKAATNPIKELNTENLLGIIRYGSSTNPGKGFKVLLKRSAVAAKIPVYTPEMVLVATSENATILEDGKSVGLMKLDERYKKADVQNFAYKLTFYYGDDNESTEIVIPVVNDELNLQQAKYDKDIFDIKPL
jgi:hypothetical protein